jgi:uncharacterized OB-fold protein
MGAEEETKESPKKGVKALVEDFLQVKGGDGRPHLMISRCDECGCQAFPPRNRCASCGGQQQSHVEAPGDGTLYTFTVVRELGKKREGFTPYALGQVDLGEDLRVMGIILAIPDSVSIGMRLRTALMPQGKDEDGNKLVGYAFAPIAD